MSEQGVRRDTGPWVQIPEWLLNAEVSDRAVRLYAVLGRYADRDGKAFPSRRTLATKLRCSVDTVDRAKRELEDIGALTVEHRTDEDGDPTSNLYTLHAQPGGRIDAVTPPLTDAATGGRTDAAQNENHVEREPSELEIAAVAAYDPLKGQQINGRNVPWDALVAVTSADERIEAGKIARALKLIRQIVVEDSAPQTFDDTEGGEWWIARQISARAALYRRRWPNVELTPTALAANWSRVVTAQPGQDPQTTLDAAQRGIDAARRTE